jgi:hypothetical protein
LHATILKSKKYVLGQVRLIFTVRGIQNLGWRLMVFSTLKNARTNQMMPLDLSVLTDLEAMKKSIV